MTDAARADRIARRLRKPVIVRNWLEITVFVLAVFLIAIYMWRMYSKRGFLVVTHAVRKGTLLKKEDVNVALAGMLDQTFQAGTDVHAFTMANDLPAGAPLRWRDVERLQPVATATIGASETLTDKNVAMKRVAYDPYAIDSLVGQKRATRFIAAETTLHADMIRNFVPTPQRQPEHAWACEIELPLHAFVGTMAVPTKSKVTLLLRARSGNVVAAAARVLSLDTSHDPATILVAVTPPTARRIVAAAPTQIYVTRTGTP